MAEEEDWAKIEREVLTAPRGKFRVVEVDTFEPLGEGHVVLGDYDRLEDALAKARDETPGSPRYVYDDQGRELSKPRKPTGGGKDSGKSEKGSNVVNLLERRLKAKEKQGQKGTKERI